MSRTIKFRVWKKSIKKYLDFVTLTMNSNGKLTGIASFNSLEPNLGKGDYILEQYTGLKDKNDKEIYEGDIVRKYSDGDIAPICGVVEFYKNGARFCVNPGYNILTQRWEVIGNIHENPGLLEDK